ncbi:oligosaccharide flippase family protein [Vibrio mimicus]|nr:oligosaccharide flippase family protein [Vibrio mimicus]BCN22654.1 putative O-antigen flippase [Vibrio mimicus]
MNQRFNRFMQQHTFIRQVTLLAGGTVLAQIINLSILPVLTRLYTPSDFGHFAIMSAIAVLGSAIVTLRYENAILTEDTIESARMGVYSIFWLSSIIGVSAALFLTGSYFISVVSRQYFLIGLIAIVFMVTSAWMQALYFYCNRNSNYKVMTKGRIYGALFLAFISISWGLWVESYWGLLLASLASIVVNLIYLYNVSVDISIVEFFSHRSDFSRFLIRNRRFPQFLLVSSLIDRAGSQGYIILFTKVFGESVTGALSLYNKVAGLPSVLIGSAIGDVFKRNASEQLRSSGQCIKLFYKTSATLFLISLCPFLLLLFFGPIIFSTIFGSEWGVAGQYAQILAPAFLLGFVVSPLSTLIYLENNQKYDLILQLILVALLVITLTLAIIYGDVYTTVTAYSFSYVSKYIIEATVCWRIASGKFNK